MSCREFYSHERSLVKRLAGRPFVLLGVNTDEDRVAIRAAVVKEQLTWRNWWDGGSRQGPIVTQWQIANWPTMYVIDHKGIIRHIMAEPGGDFAPTETVIEKLVTAAEKSATKDPK